MEWGWHEKLSPQPYREWLLSNGLERNSVNSGLVNPEKQELARGWERCQGIYLHKRKLGTEEEAGNRGGREASACLCAEGAQREPLSHRPAVYAGQRGEEVPQREPCGLAWNTSLGRSLCHPGQGPGCMTHPGKLSRAGKWQERWYTLGQRSQHSSSPPLRQTAQKSSFSMGTGGPFLAPGVRGMSLCSSGHELS